MAITLKLTLEEIRRLLQVSKKPELYPGIQCDTAMIYCIDKRHSIIDANELLENLREAI